MEESRAVAAGGAGRHGVDALHRLYDREVVGLYGFVLRRCGEVTLAEDIVQEVFLHAARRVAGGDAVPGEGWLYSTARSRVVDHWRAVTRRERKLRLVAVSEPDRQPDLVDEAIGGEALNSVLDELRPQHRAVLVLKYVDGLTTAEVASELDRSRKAVESMLARARDAFRVAYAEVTS